MYPPNFWQPQRFYHLFLPLLAHYNSGMIHDAAVKPVFLPLFTIHLWAAHSCVSNRKTEKEFYFHKKMNKKSKTRTLLSKSVKKKLK